jgi:16S rRNA (guanine1207-N2)-methyltransferase
LLRGAGWTASLRAQPNTFGFVDVWDLAHSPLPQRLHRLATLVVLQHVEQQLAVQVVEFVLEQAGEEFVGLDRHFVAVDVDADDMDLLRPHDLERHVGHGEAPFLVFPLTGGFDDLRIDEYLRIVVEVVHEEALLDPDLGCGQAKPGRVVHRHEHVVGDALEAAIDLGDLGRALAEHRVTDESDGVRSHGQKATLAFLMATPSHYFSAEPQARSQRAEIVLHQHDGTLTLVTDRGVFSPDAVDTGTRVLLDLAGPPPASGDIVDIGCGYGPIALTIARRAPEAQVWAIDTNSRARDLALINATRAGLPNVRVAAPADVPADVLFDAIYSNPPIRIGKAALHELLLGWLGRLRGDGVAWFVVHKHLGSDSLAAWLQEQGFECRKTASRLGYRVLEVRHRPA